MRLVVSKEVRQLMVRADVSIKAVYYGTCFLNQMEFTQEDNEFVVSLISFYFSMFRKYATLTLQSEQQSKKAGNKKGKKAKKGKKGEVTTSVNKQANEDPNETRLKLLSAILTGINRAMPYGDGT